MDTSINREIATVSHNDPCNIECLCGNNVNFDGFMAVDEFGTPYQFVDDGEPREDGVLLYPSDKKYLAYSACSECGRMYSNKEITEKNIARVVSCIDSNNGDLAETKALYSRANGM